MQATLLITVFALGESAPKEPPPKGPNIIGEWITVSQEQAGKPVTPMADSLTFMPDGKWARIREGKPLKNCAEYKLDADAKPATIGMIFTPDTNTQGMFGIIRLDGYTLTICYNYNPRVFPAKFESEAGSSNNLIILKRKKKE